ncbi:Uncharacterised protein [Mycobacteroides abscessus subsp. abscessus]|uniref:hypothetical protein n=1 Tax=Mycobacteroides abscessus TaxID=36809 RepID=UPI0009C9D64B|nr:hypothetical protein [Mycobacteroides abscessus]SKU84995.1 Uncharacterised protein [Mycobacteroides abscessus subsp. abscessus]SKY84882.1 Uncharacterised protein [Mycobacteroides abscessus subsp. abscessus]
MTLTGLIGGVSRRPRGKKIYEEFGEDLGTGATVRAELMKGFLQLIKAAQNPSCEGNEPITQPG